MTSKYEESIRQSTTLHRRGDHSGVRTCSLGKMAGAPMATAEYQAWTAIGIDH